MSAYKQKISLLDKIISSREWEMETLKIQQQDKKDILRQAQAEEKKVNDKVLQLENNLRELSHANKSLSLTHIQINRDFLRNQSRVLLEKQQGRQQAQNQYDSLLQQVLQKHQETRLYERVKENKVKAKQKDDFQREYKELDDLWLQKQEEHNDD